MIGTIIIFLLIFFVIVMGHEFGHFLIAKVNGIRVNEFAIGMGPKITGFKKGETEYVLRARVQHRQRRNFLAEYRK